MSAHPKVHVHISNVIISHNDYIFMYMLKC